VLHKRQAQRALTPPLELPGANAPKSSHVEVYVVDDIVDAPQHHAYARAMGLLTWGTWDAEKRPFEERLKDFLQAYPPNAPARFQGTMLTRSPEGEYGPASNLDRLARIRAATSSFGTLPETLARYGLMQQSGPDYSPNPVTVTPFREVTRVRNQRLRILHGRVDIEADNMDEAKATELDRLERKHAAEQIRQARDRMRRELGDGG
jgi:hypothetical protein